MGLYTGEIGVYDNRENLKCSPQFLTCEPHAKNYFPQAAKFVLPTENISAATTIAIIGIWLAIVIAILAQIPDSKSVRSLEF